MTLPLRRRLSQDDALALDLCSGPEAGAFLLPSPDTQPMSDVHLRTAVRRRLRVAKPVGGTGVCHHLRSDKTICGHVHGDDKGQHAVNCKIGGGVDRRHNGVRDALLAWLHSIGKLERKEQEMPKWNTPQESARLDIVCTDARLGEVAVDVSLVNTVFPGANHRAGHAIERRERMKHGRYPGPGLFPFVLDIRGRWGREAHAFVQSMVGSLDKKDRATAMRDCRSAISRALQTLAAEQLLTAAAKLPDIVPVSYRAAAGAGGAQTGAGSPAG